MFYNFTIFPVGFIRLEGKQGAAKTITINYSGVYCTSWQTMCVKLD